MVIVGLVFGGVLIVTAYASHTHEPPTTGGQVQTDPYAVGTCVAVTPGPVASTVPCDQPHTGKVAATTDYPRPCPSGTDPVDLVQQQLTLCLTP